MSCKTLLVAVALVCFFTPCAIFAHNKDKKRIHLCTVIDSNQVSPVPAKNALFGNPSIEIENEDIFRIDTFLDPVAIDLLGYAHADTLIFISTKGYHNRTEAEKQIPSPTELSLKKEKWYLKNDDKPYRGYVTDYYYSGKIYGKARIVDGYVTDTVITYFEDGHTMRAVNVVKDNFSNGPYTKYFVNGNLKMSGTYIRGKRDGYWLEWYSTSNLKRRVMYKEGTMNVMKEDNQFWLLYQNGTDLASKQHYKDAILAFAEAIS